jgi:hypothetical protein
MKGKRKINTVHLSYDLTNQRADKAKISDREQELRNTSKLVAFKRNLTRHKTKLSEKLDEENQMAVPLFKKAVADAIKSRESDTKVLKEFFLRLKLQIQKEAQDGPKNMSVELYVALFGPSLSKKLHSLFAPTKTAVFYAVEVASYLRRTSENLCDCRADEVIKDLCLKALISTALVNLAAETSKNAVKSTKNNMQLLDSETVRTLIFLEALDQYTSDKVKIKRINI